MKRFTRGLAAGALLAALLALTAAPAAQAQPNRFPEPAQQQPVFIPGGGTDLFRALMDKEGIQPVRANELNNMWGASDDMIVVVIGHPGNEWQPTSLRWARMAVQANGAALIASDSAFAVHESRVEPGWNNHITRFNGQTVSANWPDYHRQPDCPYVVPVSPEELAEPPKKPGRVWNVFRGLTRIATNQPTFLEEPAEYRNEYRYPLARLPKSSHPQWGGNRFASPPLFAIGGDGPEPWPGQPGYSFLAVADSSVFINQMIMETDPTPTDNLEFTLRTIEYLQGPGKKRKRCVFFENGRVVDKFDGLRSALAKPKPKIPPEAMPDVGSLFRKNQETIVKGIDKLADHIQTNDLLHEKLVGPRGSSSERNAAGRWLEIASVMLAIAIAFLLLRRTWGARQPMDVPPAPTTGAGAASTGPPGVFDRRQRELVRRNNLFEPVRNLMREFFDSVGAPLNPGPRLPTLEISDVVRKPESLRQAIRDMWRIAYGPPQPISAQRWFELEPYFNRLRQAHAAGKWRFVTDGT